MREDYRSVLLADARESIRAALYKQEARYPVADDPCFRDIRGAFVTLHLEGELRGCIGHFEGRSELRRSIRELARSSAFRDPRFPPLSLEEYPRISIEISILTPLKEIDGPEQFLPGRDGILIESGRASALFLPQVAPEQGWDRDTTLRHLCRKAGLAEESYRNPEMRFFTFQAEVFSEHET